ncbi:MAG: hypothetical protein Q8S14_14685 [Algoriphagus sp.]|uniref:hypothetical protein n=1 Tax=Algoriphagus sp. TaxID=1872435 RepID=UPI0027305A76|nr:hypothetical protein [Algoriphagus sp.]MDP2039845.1 hypothetical protein [Algoriphagus sp.]MDP3473113.1 hypothetical protein [Algoriphagus sp.]
MEGLELKFLESQKDLIILILKRNELENEEDLILNAREFIFQAEKTLGYKVLFSEFVLTELTEYLDSLNEMDLETWDGYKLECTLEEERIEIIYEIERLKTELPELIDIRDEINQIKTAYQEFEDRSQRSFLESKEMLQHQFAKHHSVIPSLEKLLVYKLNTKNIGETLIKELPTKLEGLRIEVEDLAIWSKEYTPLIESIFNTPDKKPNSIEKEQKSEPLAVRFKLLNEFFNGNENFTKLKIKDQHILLGFILGCHQSTSKHIKNNSVRTVPDGKYITQENLDRYAILSDKIKKGDIL